MKTQNIVKACVALGFALAFSLVNAQSTLAQAMKPRTEVGQQSMVAEGTNYSIWEERLEDPQPGFRAYNVRLKVKGTDTTGRFVNAFEELDISGVHQVWEDFRGANPSPYPGYFTAFNLPAQAQNLDSHVVFTKAQQSNGADPTETNNASNPAGLSWSQFTSIVGVGSVGVKNRGAGNPAALGLAGRTADLAFARVVLYDGTAGAFANPALMAGSVGGEGDGNSANGGEINVFSAVQIGQLVPIPEPAMGLMALLGSVSLLGLRRRNG